MLENNALISYRPVNSKYGVIDIAGDVTGDAEKDLMLVFNQAVDHGIQVIILNFQKLEYMSSSGIGLLITLLIRARRLNKELFAVGLNPHYQRIFELTHLNETIQIFTSEEDVMEQIGTE